MPHTCLIDQSNHDTVEALHKHLQFKLKVRQNVYYPQYHARTDLFTGEPIPFKSRDQYLSAEFLSKANLRSWIGKNPTKGREWAVRWLDERRRSKGLTYPPTQVELQSLLCPSIHYYDRVGGYNAICRELGYTIRFDSGLTVTNPSLVDRTVVVDTREQLPLDLPARTVRAKLNCGDYGLEPVHDQGIYIERKSLNDFIGTLSDRQCREGDDNSSNLARFTREVARAQECGSYLILLVETPIDQALHFDDLPELSRIKISPDHVFKNLRDLLCRFDNLQALFVADRSEAARAVVKLLAAGSSVKQVDLQYAYESGRLNLGDT